MPRPLHTRRRPARRFVPPDPPRPITVRDRALPAPATPRRLRKHLCSPIARSSSLVLYNRPLARRPVSPVAKYTPRAHAHARTNCLRVRAHRKSIADTRLACLSQVQPSSCSSIRSRRPLSLRQTQTRCAFYSLDTCHEFVCQCQPPCLLEPGGVASEATMHHASASHSRSDS